MAGRTARPADPSRTVDRAVRRARHRPRRCSGGRGRAARRPWPYRPRRAFARWCRSVMWSSPWSHLRGSRRRRAECGSSLWGTGRTGRRMWTWPVRTIFRAYSGNPPRPRHRCRSICAEVRTRISHEEGTTVHGLWPGALHGHAPAGRGRRHRPARQRRSRQLAERASVGAARARGRHRDRRRPGHRADAPPGPPRAGHDPDAGRCRHRGPRADRRRRRAPPHHRSALPRRRGMGSAGCGRLHSRVPRPCRGRVDCGGADDDGPGTGVSRPLGGTDRLPGRPGRLVGPPRPRPRPRTTPWRPRPAGC